MAVSTKVDVHITPHQVNIYFLGKATKFYFWKLSNVYAVYTTRVMLTKNNKLPKITNINEILSTYVQKYLLFTKL